MGYSPQIRSKKVPIRSDDETYEPLLSRTQAYLKMLLRRQAPGSALTAAWEEFYEVYDGLIRRFVIAHGVRGADVDDCVQDVWSEVAARLAEFRRPRDRPGLRAWLYRLVRSKAIDLFRHKARQSASCLAQAAGAGRESSGLGWDPAQQYELRWERSALRSAIASLHSKVSETNYRVLHMRLVQGLTVSEVAERLNVSREQVRYRHHRTMRMLRSRMSRLAGQHLRAENCQSAGRSR